MKKLDYAFLFMIYAPIYPIFLFLLGWWLSIHLVPESQIFIFALAGLALGIIIDVIFLKKALALGYNLKVIIMAAIYLFYSAGIFGFFMGVPIFNVLPGVFAAIYIARRASLSIWDNARFKRNVNRTAWFAVVVMLLICIESAYLALSDAYTSNNISGMFGLGFEVTIGMLWAIVIVGGVLLLGFQYWIVQFIAHRLEVYFQTRNSPAKSKQHIPASTR
jgi:hypothetical protein